MKKKTKLKPGLHVVGGYAVFLCFFLLVAYTFVGFSIGRHIYEKPTPLDEQFMQHALEYSNDTQAAWIAEQCASLNYTEVQGEAFCVHDFIRNQFNFSNDGHNGVKAPSDTLNSGGVCRDWSVTYAVILLKLNWSVDFVTPPNHVFVTASKGNTYCNFDQIELTCYQYT